MTASSVGPSSQEQIRWVLIIFIHQYMVDIWKIIQQMKNDHVDDLPESDVLFLAVGESLFLIVVVAAEVV